MPLKVVPRRDRKLNRLVKRADTKTLKRGEILFRAGEPSPLLFLVRTGHLRLTRPATEDEEGGTGLLGPVLEIAGPWEICGEESLTPDTPRRATALAGEPSQVTLLDALGARKALQTSQRSFEAFLRAKEAELELARALSTSRRPGGAGTRVGALLLHLSARHGRSEGKEVRIQLRLTHQLLADLSRTHRSTVTTLLNDWIYEGALMDDGEGLLILKPEALSRR